MVKKVFCLLNATFDVAILVLVIFARSFDE